MFESFFEVPVEINDKDNCYFGSTNFNSPLLVYCHGAGRYITDDKKLINLKSVIVDVAINVGYSVLVCNCMPKKFRDNNHLINDIPSCNALSLESIYKAVSYVKNEIVKKDIPIFLYGDSMGGVTVVNLLVDNKISFKGAIMDCPIVSFQQHLKFLSSYVDKLLETLLKANVLLHFDPWRIFGKKFLCPIPVLFLLGKYDYLVDANITKAFVKDIKNKNVRLLEFNNCAHVCCDSKIKPYMLEKNILCNSAQLATLIFLQENGGLNIKRIPFFEGCKRTIDVGCIVKYYFYKFFRLKQLLFLYRKLILNRICQKRN